VEWVDVYSNDNDKNDLKGLLEKSFEDTTQFIYKIYEKYLVMFWENEQIDYNIFINEQLSDPCDSIQYSLEHLAYQKEIVSKELPFLLDKQILRVNAYSLKNILEPQSNEILNKIYLSIPPEIKKRTN
jgi:dynein heavy chain, axonemal